MAITEDTLLVKIRHADQYLDVRMHLLHGSILRLAGMPPIVEGAILGLVKATIGGSGNYHLHISVSNGSGGLEDDRDDPVMFTDYEVRGRG